MGFAINKKIADKKTASNAKTNVQAGGSSKFIAKASTKSSGASKKPIKTGGSRGSWFVDHYKDFIPSKKEDFKEILLFLCFKTGNSIINFIWILYKFNMYIVY